MKNKLIAILRWSAFIPGAALGAWAGWIVMNVLGRFSLSYALIEPDSFTGQLYFNTSGSLVMGAAFVYLGAKIAPASQQIVALALASLGLLLVGFSLYPAFAASNGWAIWSGVCTVLGMGAVAYFVYTDEIELG